MASIIGEKYGDCLQWKNIIKYDVNVDIKYLEIGVYYGINFFSVLETFCKNENSELHAIDCWTDEHYNHYEKLNNKGDIIYNTFLQNVSNFSEKDKNKIKIHRGYSYEKIKNLPDNYFDMIYIDGCHEPESVMEDAVLSFRKLKNNGYIIFDDYTWSPETQKSIDSFIFAYGKRIIKLGIQGNQVFIKKHNITDTPAVSFNL
jgi:hypothetical protein